MTDAKDDDTLTGRLAALRRMIARGEQRRDALAMLDKIDAQCDALSTAVKDSVTLDQYNVLAAEYWQLTAQVVKLNAANDKANAALELSRNHHADAEHEVCNRDATIADLRAELRSQPSWLSDAAEALGQVRSEDGAPLALNWTQVLAAIREMRGEMEHERACHQNELANALHQSNATIEALREDVRKQGSAAVDLFDECRRRNATIADLRAECRRLGAAVERRNGQPHVHASRDASENPWVCACGATRFWDRKYDSTVQPWDWAEPVAAAPESEPPEGWEVALSKLSPGLRVERWYHSRVEDDRWSGDHRSRPEAVAACWAAYRAQQPATVTAPEPTLEAQLDEACSMWRVLAYDDLLAHDDPHEEAAWQKMRRLHDAVTLSRAMRAARDGKAGTC